jgi:mono/diheme cytochrome c family protein
LTASGVASESDGALFWKIGAGRDPMPAFDQMTSDADRWNVINYLRSLQKRPATAPASRP